MAKPPTWCYMFGELAGLYEVVLSGHPVNKAHYESRLKQLERMELDNEDIDYIINELQQLRCLAKKPLRK